MMNWYSMGMNAPSQIDEARERAAAARSGSLYTEADRRAYEAQQRRCENARVLQAIH